MNLKLTAAADAEAFEAASYYESRRPGLGKEFHQALDLALDSIIEYPNASTRIGRNIRRLRVSGFPYGVVYEIRGDVIRVIAVMHLKRRPGYWRGR